MPSPHFQPSPEYIEDHGESLKQLTAMWDNYTEARTQYAHSLLSFNFKNAGMNNVEKNLVEGNDEIRRAYKSYIEAKSELRASHNYYKASYSALIQGKRL